MEERHATKLNDTCCRLARRLDNHEDPEELLRAIIYYMNTLGWQIDKLRIDLDRKRGR